MDILSILIIFVSGFFIGRAYTYWTVYQALKEIADGEGLDLEQELLRLKNKREQEDADIEVHSLQIEEHGDMLYLFERDSDNFICQAKSIDELAKLAKEYKNIIAASVKYDKKVFMFADGLSKEYSE